MYLRFSCSIIDHSAISLSYRSPYSACVFMIYLVFILYSSGHVQVLHHMNLGKNHEMLMAGVSCKGDEQSLFECAHNDDDDCDEWEDHVYIICNAG